MTSAMSAQASRSTTTLRLSLSLRHTVAMSAASAIVHVSVVKAKAQTYTAVKSFRVQVFALSDSELIADVLASACVKPSAKFYDGSLLLQKAKTWTTPPAGAGADKSSWQQLNMRDVVSSAHGYCTSPAAVRS